MNKPIYLIDLDDNIFQSKQKLTIQKKIPHKTAALDRDLVPRSFMTQTQSNFIDWLLRSATVIPVTGRSVEEYSRVTINFNSWKVMAHGAVIHTFNNEPDLEWKNHIISKLVSYQDQFIERKNLLISTLTKHKVAAQARINYEYDDIGVYLVLKHTDSSLINEIYSVANIVNEQLGTEGFYLHKNGNNISWLPTFINKGLAVKHLLQKLKTNKYAIPIIGLGDSISDYSFLKLSDWFGMPQNTQLADALKNAISFSEHK